MKASQAAVREEKRSCSDWQRSRKGVFGLICRGGRVLQVAGVAAAGVAELTGAAGLHPTGKEEAPAAAKRKGCKPETTWRAYGMLGQ